MKILNINSYYYSSTVHKQLFQAQLDEEIDAFTYVPVHKKYIQREDCKYGEESKVKRAECYNNIDRYVFHIKHAKILKSIVKDIDINYYDCIHAHSLFSNGYIAMKIKEKFKIPYIVAVRDTDVNTFFKRMPHLRRLGNKILHEASGVIFLSIPYRDKVIREYANYCNKDSLLSKSHIIPNGIDEFWLNNKGTPKTLDFQNKINLLHVGAVSKRKNILTTINSIKLLKEKGYDIKLTVVGKIVHEEIYAKIKKYGYIEYISPKSKNELLKIYRTNDIFVMPSFTETFGLVYPEAMSQGLPVLYTMGQGFDGQFEDGEVGYRVDCFNPNELAEKVIQVLERYDNISKKAIEKSSRFNWKLIVKDYKEIYSNVCNTK